MDESLYLIILPLTKISILLFYLRIFPRRRFQYTTIATLVFVALSGFVILLLQIFQCLPVAYNWDKNIRNAKCLNVNALTYTHAGLSIGQDLLILVLPISELVKLQLGRTQRLGLLFVFQIGALYVDQLHSRTSRPLTYQYSACITSMIRLRFLTQFGGTNSIDPTCQYLGSADICRWANRVRIRGQCRRHNLDSPRSQHGNYLQLSPGFSRAAELPFTRPS